VQAPSRRTQTAVVAAAASLVALFVARRQAWVCDDALITFRYVDNWISGHGLVFNLGERVEGFSNPLFVALLAPFARAGLDLFAVATTFGLASIMLEATLLVWLTARATGSTWIAAAAAALFCSDRIVAVWATGGLETGMHALLVTAAFAVCVFELDAPGRRVHAATALLLAVAVSRPEGALFFVLYLAQLLVTARPPARSIVRALNLFLPVAALLLAARYLYYGELIANPYRAKVAGVPGLAFGLGQARAFAARCGLSGPVALAWLPLVAATVAALRGAGDEQQRALRRRLVLALLWIGAQIAAAIAMGGDYMNDFRFFAPVMAIVVFAVACALGLVARAPHRGAAVVAAASFAVLLAAHAWLQRIGSPVFADAPPAVEHKQILTVTRARSDRFTEALMRIAEPGDSLVVDWAGVMGFGHALRTVDCTGLVSRNIAGDFYLRKEWSDDRSRRERLPGHARWPTVDYMRREQFTFIFPKVNRLPPEQPEITPAMPARTQGYPFLHVTVPLDGGEYFRFFTTLTPETLAARAHARGLRICWRPPWGELTCSG
jgi:arabinofuranosyltransferase